MEYAAETLSGGGRDRVLDTFTWVTGKYDYVNPPALKRLLVAGAILRPFPQEVLEACYNAANEIYADLSKTNPHFARCIRA